MGDIFSVRVAGNITSRKVLGSLEYGCAAGAKLIVVMGHTHCGAVAAAVDLFGATEAADHATGCQHLGHIIQDIQQSIDPRTYRGVEQLAAPEKEAFVNDVARRNVARAAAMMLQQSRTLDGLVRDGRVAVVGVMYDVATGDIDFLTDAATDRVPAAGLA